jgi:hypothetical protein
LTCSHSRKRDGIPILTSRVSCFGETSPLRFHSYLVLPSLHRRMRFRKPCGTISVCSSSVAWFSQPAKERECTLVKHANAFTQANALACNLQTLFRCQGTTQVFFFHCPKAELRACGRRSFLLLRLRGKSSERRSL